MTGKIDLNRLESISRPYTRWVGLAYVIIVHTYTARSNLHSIVQRTANLWLIWINLSPTRANSLDAGGTGTGQSTKQ